MIRTGRVGLPTLNHSADGAVEEQIAATTSGEPIILFRLQPMAACNKRRLVARKEFQIDTLRGESGFDRGACRAPDRHAPVPHWLWRFRLWCHFPKSSTPSGASGEATPRFRPY